MKSMKSTATMQRTQPVRCGVVDANLIQNLENRCITLRLAFIHMVIGELSQTERWCIRNEYKS